MLTTLLPGLFIGLKNALNREKELTITVSKQQVSLKDSVELLRQKNNELELFAYTASHDLKERLRMVINFMELLKNKYNGVFDKKAQQYIDFAIDGGLRMRQMTDDLLELSRTARTDTTKILINLDQLVREVEQNLWRLIQETQADIQVKTTLPVLFIYKSDYARLFQNLITNAIKFAVSIPSLLLK
jgi:light-regulated signal transduction histidine kinase (bacteriophytochrome)